VALGAHVAQQGQEARAVARDQPDLDLVAPGLVVQHAGEAEAEEGREHREARGGALPRVEPAHARIIYNCAAAGYAPPPCGFW
jgi:hypothetical protein